jgi:hypothetical protein
MPTFDPFFNPIMHVAERKQLLVGNMVRIQNAILKRWDNKGTIKEIRDSGQSYYVDRDIGQDTVLCKKNFLKRLTAPFALHETE